MKLINVVTNVIKLKCLSVFSDLPPKSRTVCCSTTAASTRNTTSSPWRSSMSRSSSPSQLVERFLVYSFFIMNMFSCFTPFLPRVCCRHSPLWLFSRWDQNYSFAVHPRRSQRRPVARGGGPLLQQGMIQNKSTELFPQTHTCVCRTWLMIRFPNLVEIEIVVLFLYNVEEQQA